MPNLNFWIYLYDDIGVEQIKEYEEENGYGDYTKMHLERAITYLPAFTFNKNNRSPFETYKLLLPDPYVTKGHPRTYEKDYQGVLKRV